MLYVTRGGHARPMMKTIDLFNIENVGLMSPYILHLIYCFTSKIISVINYRLYENIIWNEIENKTINPISN